MSAHPVRFIPAVALLLAIPACDRDQQAEENTSMEEAGEGPTNRVDIPAGVRSNLGITFAKVERRNVANTVRVPGSFELMPLARHEYRLMLPGQVKFEVDQFDKVEPGTLLYRFRSPKWLEMQAQIDLAVATLDQAQAKYAALEARIQALARADFKRADLEAEVAELQADVVKREAELQAALNNATRTLNAYGDSERGAMAPDELLSTVEIDGQPVPRYQAIDRIEVRAIEPGIVESLTVTDGSFVEETTLVLTTVDPDQVRFRALGLQGDLARFRGDRKARIVPPQADGADLNESVAAELKIGLAADPAQRTVTLFARPLDLREWTRPGVSAFLEVVTTSTDGEALAIPRSAVVKDGITHVFFKRDPSNANKAIRVEADLGVDDGRWVEIKSGIGPNDEVVLEGAYELKLATALSGSVQKGGHFHADGTYHEQH